MLKNNINKSNIAKDLTFKLGFSQNFSKKIIDALIQIILNEVKKKGCSLKNIGSFKIINKKARIGRNPKTKEQYEISARKSISFTTSKKISNSLKDLI